MGTSHPSKLSTKLDRIAKLAEEMPSAQMRTLAHHIDVEWLHEAHRLTRKSGAPGIDGQTAKDYEQNLRANLEDLLRRMHDRKAYRAPPVRRTHIPKDDGRMRPIGIPTHEDKVLQRAAVMALNAVYEQDFLDCSYGFRPGRSAQDALDQLWKSLTTMGGGWVVEADIEGFFDSVDHKLLRQIFNKRITDGVIDRLVGKWLKAGVMEEGCVYHPETGVPQGGVISPLLANVFLHEVLDVWFEQEVKPRCRGEAQLIRYADDFVCVFKVKADAERFFEVLPKRFARYGLRLHPEKTRLVNFTKPRGDDGWESFDLLGFTLYWGKSRKGNRTVKTKTRKGRIKRTLKRTSDWCRHNRHQSLSDQCRTLGAKLRGHYQYFGRPGNFPALMSIYRAVEDTAVKWLSRRKQSRPFSWTKREQVLEKLALPAPRIHPRPNLC